MAEGIVGQIVNGDIRAAAKLIRDIDNGVPGTREILKALHRYTGNAYKIGITGPPVSVRVPLWTRWSAG